MKNLFYFLLICCNFTLSAQVTIVVSEVPKETPTNAVILCSGDFEGWTGGKKNIN